MNDPIKKIEFEAKKRSHRFSDRAWQQWLNQGGLQLARDLQQTSWKPIEKEQVFEGALKLAAEAVSCGYLPYRPEQTPQSWFEWIWYEVLATRLPRLTPVAALEELATLFNFSESLELGQVWRKKLFFLFRQQLTPERSLQDFITHIDQQLSPNSLTPLSENTRQWQIRHMSLSAFSPYALPAAPHFIAPRIVGVHARETENLFLYLLTPEPLPLGLGGRQLLEDLPKPPLLTRETLAFREQHRLGELQHEISNPWFWVGVPSLSQRIYFAWSPEKGTR